jgi:hypothetical protein
MHATTSHSLSLSHSLFSLSLSLSHSCILFILAETVDLEPFSIPKSEKEVLAITVNEFIGVEDAAVGRLRPSDSSDAYTTGFAQATHDDLVYMHDDPQPASLGAIQETDTVQLLSLRSNPEAESVADLSLSLTDDDDDISVPQDTIVNISSTSTTAYPS